MAALHIWKLAENWTNAKKAYISLDLVDNIEITLNYTVNFRYIIYIPPVVMIKYDEEY
jgi:hypothetical protein